MAALESKNAGRFLALIVLVLLLPILLLGWFYYSLARVEITGLQNELAGTRLLHEVYPLYLSDIRQPSREQLANIHKLETAIPSNGHAGFEIHWANSMRAQPPRKLSETGYFSYNALVAFFGNVASDSGLATDNDLPSFLMIDATVLTLPRLSSDMRILGTQMQDLAADQSNYNTKITRIAQVQGRVLASWTRFQDSMSRSYESGSDGPAMTQIKAEGRRIDDAIKAMSDLIANASQGMSMDYQARFMNIEEAIATINKSALAISRPAFAVLDGKLQTRLSAARFKLYFLSFLGLAAATVSLGLAFQMFRRTLTKLDQVESAHVLALRAQGEAERINDEIAVLNRSLAEKVKALEEAQNEIVKKGRMEQLGQLTATIAHELRNPLGSVRTSAYLINRKAGGKGLGIDEQISRIEKGVVRCDNIITQLLDFSRTKQLTAMPANLDSWLAGIITEEANKLPANMQIDCILGLDDTSVPFDPARLQRAIINLMSNAVEAMTSKDANALDRSGGYPQIWIRTFRAGDEAAICVKDNGPGIDPDLISRIREPLYTTKSFGTGLGIPAIEQIAVQHGGRLDIQSRVGEGAEFTIYIPIFHLQAEPKEGSANILAVA